MRLCSVTSLRMRVIVRLAAFMEFPITMPPSGMRYRAVAGTTQAASSSPNVATAATPTAKAAMRKALGTSPALRAEVQAAKRTIPARSNATTPRLVEPEDVVYDVPYRGELHARADHGDADVLLEVQPLVEAEEDRDGDETE